MKDLSFILSVVDRNWLGLVPRPSSTGTQVMRVEKLIGQVPFVHDSVGDPWWRVHLGHITWGVMTEHPVDAWLLDVAWRHSS